jgi:UDP-glucose 4-epimerase
LKAYERLSEDKQKIKDFEDPESSSGWQGYFETFNLWVWRWISVFELLKVCEEESWKKIPYKIIERRSWDLGEVYCDPKKAKEFLKWEAKISLNESVKSGLRFYGIS